MKKNYEGEDFKLCPITKERCTKDCGFFDENYLQCAVLSIAQHIEGFRDIDELKRVLIWRGSNYR